MGQKMVTVLTDWSEEESKVRWEMLESRDWVIVLWWQVKVCECSGEEVSEGIPTSPEYEILSDPELE